jgi:hypothetical protein
MATAVNSNLVLAVIASVATIFRVSALISDIFERSEWLREEGKGAPIDGDW